MPANLLVPSGLLAMAMAWSIGAQDVAKSMATSVGARALTVIQALAVAAVFEFSGSLLGGEVVFTISKGLVSRDTLPDQLYVEAMFCTLGGAFLWLAVATKKAWPVSTTHSLVASLLGIMLVSGHWSALNQGLLAKVVGSWFISPLFGLVTAYLLFSVIHKRVLLNPHPERAAYRALPFLYGFTAFTLLLFLVVAGPVDLDLSTSFVAAASLATVIVLVMKLRLRKELQRLADKDKDLQSYHHHHSPVSASAGAAGGHGGHGHSHGHGHSDPPKSFVTVLNVQPLDPESTSGHAVHHSGHGNGQTHGHSHSHGHSHGSSGGGGGAVDTQQLQRTERLFVKLLVMTACVVALAHASNDVSNAIGPFAGIVETYATPRTVSQGGWLPDPSPDVPAPVAAADEPARKPGAGTSSRQQQAALSPPTENLSLTDRLKRAGQAWRRRAAAADAEAKQQQRDKRAEKQQQQQEPSAASAEHGHGDHSPESERPIEAEDPKARSALQRFAKRDQTQQAPDPTFARYRPRKGDAAAASSSRSSRNSGRFHSGGSESPGHVVDDTEHGGQDAERSAEIARAAAKASVRAVKSVMSSRFVDDSPAAAAAADAAVTPQSSRASGAAGAAGASAAAAPAQGVPMWILVAGGLGIVVGLATYGTNVMRTISEQFIPLTCSRGFAAQIATAISVLLATMTGMSVSTTHCLIGAMSGVALVEGADKINRATLRTTLIGWVVTMPASACASLLMYAFLKML